MSTVALTTEYEVRALEVLTIARTIMSYSGDQDLIEKVTMLQEYLDLAAMYPDHDYGVIIGRTTTQLIGVIHGMLKCDVIAGGVARQRTALFERAAEFAAGQGIRRTPENRVQETCSGVE